MITTSRILVPTDFSACSSRALEYAVMLGEKLGARVYLLHVVGQLSLFIPEAVLEAATVPSPAEELIGAARMALEREAKKYPGADLEVHVAEGAAYDQVLRFAADNAIDLIVMGTHGHTGLTHMLLGSVAERVVRTAPCPVFTVRHP